MKTLIDVKMERDNLFEEAKLLKPSVDGKRVISAAKKRIKFLDLVIIYLESSPKAEYISGSLWGLKDKLRRIMNDCPFLDDKNPEGKKLRMAWLKEHDVEKIKGQIKFLNYILN